jgi:hypothetical protein
VLSVKRLYLKGFEGRGKEENRNVHTPNSSNMKLDEGYVELEVGPGRGHNKWEILNTDLEGPQGCETLRLTHFL